MRLLISTIPYAYRFCRRYLFGKSTKVSQTALYKARHQQISMAASIRITTTKTNPIHLSWSTTIRSIFSATAMSKVYRMNRSYQKHNTHQAMRTTMMKETDQSVFSIRHWPRQMSSLARRTFNWMHPRQRSNWIVARCRKRRTGMMHTVPTSQVTLQ